MNIKVGDKFIWYPINGNPHNCEIVNINDFRPYAEKYAISIDDCSDLRFVGDSFFYSEGECITWVDEVGGHHSCGIGWNPQGMWCGECTKMSCKGCPNEHEIIPAYEKKIEYVFVIECTAWDEPEIHKTYKGAFEGLIEGIKNTYSQYIDDFGNNPDPSAIITDAYEQYNQGRKTICVEDSEDCYRLYPISLMN